MKGVLFTTQAQGPRNIFFWFTREVEELVGREYSTRVPKTLAGFLPLSYDAHVFKVIYTSLHCFGISFLGVTSSRSLPAGDIVGCSDCTIVCLGASNPTVS